MKNEDIKDGFKARGLKKAKEVLDVLRLSDEERRAYEYYIEDLRYQASMYLSSYGVGKHKGHKEGLKEGQLAEKYDLARKMYREGFDAALISKITGLTNQEIEDLL